MPVLEQGYEAYRGPVKTGGSRAVAIGVTALRRNNRWWVWVLLVLSWVLGSGLEYLFLFLGYTALGDGGRDNPSGLNFAEIFVRHPNFYSDLMKTQSFWAIVMGAVVGAGEIAEDLRSGALVFYLGRPLTRRDYVLGKALAVSVPVILVSAVPTLILFALQALFEGRWEWLRENARVVPAAAAYGLVLAFFVSGVVLGVSAVARRRRWATIAIVGFLLGLSLTAWVLAPSRWWTSDREKEAARRQFQDAKSPEERRAALLRLSDAFDPLGSNTERAELRALSPEADLAAVGRDLFGRPLPSNFPGARHWVLVLGASAISFGVLWRRVRAVEIVA